MAHDQWHVSFRGRRWPKRRVRPSVDRERSAANQHLVGLVETLEAAAATLARNDAIHNAAKAFDDAGDNNERWEAAKCLHSNAALIEKLLETAEHIDPHVLNEQELADLWDMKPRDLADDAILNGSLRERRLVLEAMAEQTNRRLGWTAIGAAIAALLVPFVDKVAQGL